MEMNEEYVPEYLEELLSGYARLYQLEEESFVWQRQAQDSSAAPVRVAQGMQAKAGGVS